MEKNHNKLFQSDTGQILNTKSNRYSIFVLGEKVFGLELSLVKEVISLPRISKLPNAPEHILGVFNFRGSIITLVEAAKLLGVSWTNISEDNMIVVVEQYKQVSGILAERVLDLIAIDETEIQLPTREMPPTMAEYITGSYEKEEIGIIYLLNLKKLLSPHIFILNENS